MEPSAKLPVDILIEARSLLTMKGSWVQKYLWHYSEGVDQFCMWGAMLQVTAPQDSMNMMRAAEIVLNQDIADIPQKGDATMKSRLVAWNDAHARTHEQVLQRLDEAIIRCRKYNRALPVPGFS